MTNVNRDATNSRSRDRGTVRARAARGLDAGRSRLDRPWAGDLIARLKAADFVNSIILFGAALMLSVLPLVVLLSSLANQRVDDDISRHIGLNGHGARIVEALFHYSTRKSTLAIATALLIAFAGTMTVAGSLQVVYEKVFGHEHRGRRDLPRLVLWVAVLLLALASEVALGKPVHSAGGPVAQGAVSFAAVTVFLVWTMHFLLGGRTPWRALVRPALLTAVLWLGLGVFSALYFSSAIISDSKLYGTIGVVFTLLTWFIAIGAVVVLGAAGGAVWQARASAKKRGAGDRERTAAILPSATDASRRSPGPAT